MATQKFMGRGQLVKRLAAQMGSEEAAKDLLIKRGHMSPNGELTAEGRRRNAMTAEERALDRASKKSGHSKTQYKYDPKTNRAVLKGRGL